LTAINGLRCGPAADFREINSIDTSPLPELATYEAMIRAVSHRLDRSGLAVFLREVLKTEGLNQLPQTVGSSFRGINSANFPETTSRAFGSTSTGRALELCRWHGVCARFAS
jgi:hypothetical protein